MKRTENELDSRQVLSVIEKYNTALDLLDSYDHQNMNRIYLEKKKMILLKEVLEIFINPMQVRIFMSP